MSTVLEVNELTTKFRARRTEITAVSNVSFSVAAGRVLGIVGESGSGKSVTARSIMGLLSERGYVANGDIYFQGQDVLAKPNTEWQRLRGADIAMVFQDPQSSLNPVLRIGEQVREALLVHGADADTANSRAIELLEQVGIPDPESALKCYPHQFSGGMRQRVVIAIALANNPKLLIADEPTTALDVTIQAQILSLLAQLRKTLGISIIMITHDMGVVAELCDDVVVMYAGRVVERGTTTEIFEARRHPYTAALFNAVPRMDGTGNGLTAIPGNPPLAGSLPSGCAFRTRCLFAHDACKSEIPPMVALTGTHAAACLYTSDLNKSLSPAKSTVVAVERKVVESQTPILQVNNLKTDVNESAHGLFNMRKPVYAVNDVSLQVFPGQTMGLVGESGCGKSTLSRTIVGINKSANGSIVVDGRDVTAMTPEDKAHIAKTIQYVFQDPTAALNPRRTVGQSLAEALEIVHSFGDAALHRSRDLLEQVGLSATHLNRYPYELSGGQKQRVGIARALAVEPKMLICDEPVSALDVSIQAQIINLLAKLRDELNLGYLFIAHDLSVVRHISDQLAVMYLGRFVETGQASDIYAQPKHPYTASLLSAIPVADINHDTRTRIVLEGDMPSMSKPPSGCPFRTRCPIGPSYHSNRQDCIEQRPELFEVDASQAAACHHWPDVGSNKIAGSSQ